MLTVLSGVRWCSIHKTTPWLLPGLWERAGRMVGQTETAT